MRDHCRGAASGRLRHAGGGGLTSRKDAKTRRFGGSRAGYPNKLLASLGLCARNPMALPANARFVLIYLRVSVSSLLPGGQADADNSPFEPFIVLSHVESPFRLDGDLLKTGLFNGPQIVALGTSHS